jgi:catechol 2,3-dioxygenase-like lactoylglutathione lyase family enzyme
MRYRLEAAHNAENRSQNTGRAMMSTTGTLTGDAGSAASAKNVDMSLEVVVIPVSDVDRAEEFYGRLGWRLDADRSVGDDFRLVQFTPPGSACSVQFGISLTSAVPGSAQALILAVSAVETAHQELVDRGVEVSDVYHCLQLHGGRAVRRRAADMNDCFTERSDSSGVAQLADTLSAGRRCR